MSLERLITAIEAAPITRKQKGIALGLLMRASTGHVTLTWAEAQVLCECSSNGPVRRHLVALKAAGLIHYNTNAKVRVDFEIAETSPEISERAQEISQRSQPAADDGRDLSARAGDPSARADTQWDTPAPPAEISERAQEISQRSQPAADDDRDLSEISRDLSARAGDLSEISGGTIGGIGLDGSTTPAHPGDLDPSNPIQKADPPKTFALLTDPDIAMARPVVKEIAGKLPPLDVFRQCVRYLLDRADGSVTSSGALIHRLANPDKFPPQPVDARGRKLAYYQRHARTVGEDVANTKNYVPDEFANVIRT